MLLTPPTIPYPQLLRSSKVPSSKLEAWLCAYVSRVTPPA